MSSNSESTITHNNSPMTKQSFRFAFCLKAGFKYEPLKPYCQGIVLCTDGFSTATTLIAIQLSKHLKEFDPMQDCIIPVGTPMINLIAGHILHELFFDEPITFGFFQKAQENFRGSIAPAYYIFETVNLSSIT